MTKFLGAFLLVFMLGSAGPMASSGGEHGDLGSTVLHCYTERDEDGNPSGDTLLIKRSSHDDDWRLYNFMSLVDGKPVNSRGHALLLQRAEHLRGEDGQPMSKFELYQERFTKEAVHFEGLIEISVTTYELYQDAAGGYADIYAYNKSENTRKLIKSFDGCIASGLFKPHAMDDKPDNG